MNKLKLVQEIQGIADKLETSKLSEKDVKSLSLKIKKALKLIDLINYNGLTVLEYFTKEDLFGVVNLWKLGMEAYLNLIRYIKESEIGGLDVIKKDVQDLYQTNYKLRGFRIEAVKLDKEMNNYLPKIDNLYKHVMKKF